MSVMFLIDVVEEVPVPFNFVFEMLLNVFRDVSKIQSAQLLRTFYI